MTTDSFATILSPGIYTVTLTDDAACVVTRDFLVSDPAYPAGFDLRVALTSQRMVRGDTSYIWLDGMNDGCVATTGQMDFTLDPNVNFYMSVPPPSSISGSTLTWNFTAMDYDSPHVMPVVQVITDTSAALGDTVCFDLVITPTAGDADPVNNSLHYCTTVRAAFDPNLISVLPQGECEEHFVLLGQPLTYSILFQNLGTAAAENVYILDSLDTNLDLNTVSVKSSSHFMHTEILPGNVLRFVFNGINLPDATTDEPGSHGYVIFEVSPDMMVPSGTLVANDAAIYFDFNPPVFTNEVSNTFIDLIPPCVPEAVDPAVSQAFSIYPNPARASFTLKSASAFTGDIELISIQGEVVCRYPVAEAREVKLPLDGITPGLYLMRIGAGPQPMFIKFIVY